MILREALAGARERLRASGSDEPEIEAEVLLRYALDLDRVTFLRLLNEPISSAEAQAYERVLYRRFAGEPTAYITGTREFYGLDFKVTPAVLIPRPETEMLVEAVIALCKASTNGTGASSNTARPEALEEPALSESKGRARPSTIVDVGTGSGAIAISLARTLPSAVIYATDISQEALGVARENAKRHGVLDRISFRRGDLLEPLDTRVDIVVANLPYVTEADWQQLPREIRDHEPRGALASGADGLNAIKTLLRQAPPYLEPGGSIFLEFGIGQAEAIQEIASASLPGADIRVDKDFGGIPRLLTVKT